MSAYSLDMLSAITAWVDGIFEFIPNHGPESKAAVWSTVKEAADEHEYGWGPWHFARDQSYFCETLKSTRAALCYHRLSRLDRILLIDRKVIATNHLKATVSISHSLMLELDKAISDLIWDVAEEYWYWKVSLSVRHLLLVNHLHWLMKGVHG